MDHVRLVSWDVDGTLYSVRKLKVLLFERFVRELAKGKGELVRQQLENLKRYHSMIDNARLADGALDQKVIALGQSLISTERHWYERGIRRVGPRKGLRQVIEYIQSLGVAQVIYSDYEAAYKLDALALTEYFEKIYVGVALGFVKPSPKVLEMIALDFGLKPTEIIHIGDRVDADQRAAEAAGCPSLILGKDFHNFRSLLSQLQSR